MAQRSRGWEKSEQPTGIRGLALLPLSGTGLSPSPSPRSKCLRIPLQFIETERK